MITSQIQRVTKVSSVYFDGAYMMMILGKNMGLIGKIEDTKEIIRSCKLKKDIQHNGQQEKDKNGLQNITQKTKDRTT